MTHIPNEIVNLIIGYARPPKPQYVYHLTRICKIVAFKMAMGNGNCRVIDYMANVRNNKRLDKLKTRNHRLVLYQLKRVIVSYIIEKEISDDFGDISLGEWYKWWIYEDMFYTSGDPNYDNNDY